MVKRYDRKEQIVMTDGVNRFLGDTPGRTLVKLLAVSLMVGFIMSVLGLYPIDILLWVRRFVIDLWQTGFAALGRVGDYLILGAAVVIPVFIILRLIRFRKT